MPIYEYHCETCNEDFEKLVFGKDLVTCPRCSGEKVKRLLSACGFKSSGSFTPSTGSSGCAGCTSTSCSTCH